ncbi:TetR family transcriptional regulator [Nostocoides sp. F2B08]|uniref:TetR/AcrR family transcriptional regulator n=1 Tax=Nostocoides sp. F2B08 TaxID=2653936 RepID=UPI0012633D24|nr:TetR/AcrR family transcriptional regulator [Tetrasphaera sp. F2B08]KAB7744708.1 TetR family transcriptional regulator [Tetrasphaera sp. F2B08]
MSDRVMPARSRRKRRAILDAALEAFLAGGYDAANLDAISSAAGVSKVTIYQHFGSKEGLFVALIEEEIHRAEHESDEYLEARTDSPDVEEDLRSFAREFLETVMSPHLVAMRRLVVATAPRFPALAEAWFRNGPERGYETLADLFRRLDEQGRLRVPDARVAARAFTWLLLGAPLNEAMFRVDWAGSDPEQRAALADDAVEVFLMAYGRTGPRQADGEMLP